LIECIEFASTATLHALAIVRNGQILLDLVEFDQRQFAIEVQPFAMGNAVALAGLRALRRSGEIAVETVGEVACDGLALQAQFAHCIEIEILTVRGIGGVRELEQHVVRLGQHLVQSVRYLGSCKRRAFIQQAR